MNRKLLVTLLRKDIQELDMITEGFMEMNEYPKAIISLAQRKADDIQSYIRQLAEIKAEPTTEHVIPAEIEIPEIKSESISSAAPTISEPIIEQTIEEEEEEEEVEAEVILAEDLEIIETPVEVVEQKDTTTGMLVEIIDETPAKQPVQQENVQTETKPASDEIRRTVLSERATNNGVTSRNEALSKEDHSLGAILANKKIDDIKQAINIGDRFRFQRELFKGNGEDMNKTLNYINQLATLVEVQAFLQSKYNWSEDNESAEDFYHIVKRRFI
jgi:hypothetical protein